MFILRRLYSRNFGSYAHALQVDSPIMKFPKPVKKWIYIIFCIWNFRIYSFHFSIQNKTSVKDLYQVASFYSYSLVYLYPPTFCFVCCVLFHVHIHLFCPFNLHFFVLIIQKLDAMVNVLLLSIINYSAPYYIFLI